MENLWQNFQPIGRSLADCITLKPQFESPIFFIYHWHCRRDSEALAGERHHPWPVLTLPQAGASFARSHGRSLLLDPGSAMLHEPFAVYATSHPFGCDDCGWNVAIHPEALGRGMDEGREPLIHMAQLPERTLAWWRLALERWRRGLAGEPAVVEEATFALLGEVHVRLKETGSRPAPRRPRRPDTERDHALLYERVRAEIFRRYREPLRLADLARAACTSPFHLCRVFSRASGFPVHRYVNRLRLLTALDILAERDVALTDLAADLGFASHSHFTLAFRRELGLTPSEFREKATGRRVTAARRVLGRTV